jgi:hypothetical protein
LEESFDDKKCNALQNSASGIEDHFIAVFLSLVSSPFIFSFVWFEALVGRSGVPMLDQNKPVIKTVAQSN